jgi:hypothetical protein
MEISLGYDTTWELILSTIHQMLMDEVDVEGEGEPICHAIERKMKDDTNRAIFLEPNNILEDIESWLAQNFEHADDTQTYRENEHVKVITTTTEQRKSQQHVQFGDYPKRMVKKFCTPNPNEATDEFEYAPSPPEKRRMNLYYTAVVTTSVHRSYSSEFEMDNIVDLTSDEPSMIMAFTNASKLLKLEKSIKSIELDRVYLNTAQLTISVELKQVIQAMIAQSKESNAMQSEMGNTYTLIKDLHSHIMPDSRQLPPRPNYA